MIQYQHYEMAKPSKCERMCVLLYQSPSICSKKRRHFGEVQIATTDNTFTVGIKEMGRGVLSTVLEKKDLQDPRLLLKNGRVLCAILQWGWGMGDWSP